MSLLDDVTQDQLDQLDWNELTVNPAAIPLLEKHPDRIDWFYLSSNPAAIHILKANLDKVDWTVISRNPAAIRLLEKNLDKVEWGNLSSNPAALSLLEKYPEKIRWECLLLNSAAGALMEKNSDKRELTLRFMTEKLLDTLESNGISQADFRELTGISDFQYQEYFWKFLSMNPSIFTYDYPAMKHSRVYKEELMERMFHPRNYHRFASWGFDEFFKFVAEGVRS